MQLLDILTVTTEYRSTGRYFDFMGWKKEWKNVLHTLDPDDFSGV